MYREDPDLEFLQRLPNEDLEGLVQILTMDEDGEERFTGELTTDDRYEKHSPNHHAYWDLIAAEIQCFGANTLATLLRGGEGVLYREVLTDVCDKMNVSYKSESNGSIKAIEALLLAEVLLRWMSGLRPEYRKSVCETFKWESLPHTSEIIRDILQGTDVGHAIVVCIANIVTGIPLEGGRLAPAAAGAAGLSGGLGAAGLAFTTLSPLLPLSILVAGVAGLVTISDPNYDVTVPAVIMVACLRHADAHAH